MLHDPFLSSAEDDKDSSFALNGRTSMRINADALQQMLKSGVLHLEPFPDMHVALRTIRLDQIKPGVWSWYGSDPSHQLAQGHLGIMGLDSPGQIIISGALYLNGLVYCLRPADDGGVHVDHVHTSTRFFGKDEVIDSRTSLSPTLQQGNDSNEAVIHILAVYPIHAEKLYSEEFLDSWVADVQAGVNLIMYNSGISASVVLSRQRADLLQGTLMSHMVLQMDPKSAVWVELENLREKNQADIIALLAPDSPVNESLHGQASDIPIPVSHLNSGLQHAIMAMQMAPSGYPTAWVFAHELGHLLGGSHDPWTNGGVPDRKYDYVRGYVPANLAFTTVMGYPHNEKRARERDIPNIQYSGIPCFSTPDKQWNNQPLGIEVGQPEAADAARWFRLSTREVAKYRSHAVPATDVFPVSLNVSPELGGTIMPDRLGPYGPHDSVKLQAIPRAGYLFDHWSSGDVIIGQAPELKLEVGSEQTVTAVFRESPSVHVTVDLDADEGELISKPAQPVKSGTKCQITYVPPAKPRVRPAGEALFWEFDGHLLPFGPSDSINNSLELVVEKSHRIKAVYRMSSPYVSFGINTVDDMVVNPQIFCTNTEYSLSYQLTDRSTYDPLPAHEIQIGTSTPKVLDILTTTDVPDSKTGIGTIKFRTTNLGGPAWISLTMAPYPTVEFLIDIDRDALEIAGLPLTFSDIDTSRTKPIEVLYRHDGAPVGAGKTVTLQVMTKTGKIAHEETLKTNNSGQVQFSPPHVKGEYDGDWIKSSVRVWAPGGPRPAICVIHKRY
ncbi:InlB B-repeat-containing protein [Enterobacter asburiae]